MKLLVSINFNRIMNEQTLRPLINSDRVTRIYVVHDIDVPQMPKLERYNTPKWLYSPGHRLTLRGVIRTLWHFLLVFFIAIIKKPDAIVGFYIFPHALYAFICGKILRKPAIACIVDWPGIWHLKRRLIPMLKHCDVITTTGTKTQEFLLKQGVNKKKLFILPDSIDIERFKPLFLPKNYDIIFMGRIAPAKNVDTLLRVIAKVKKSKSNLTVGIVGDGPLMDSMKTLAAQLGITDNVEFLGFRNDPEQYYNSAKIFVLTSYYEGLPMAMLEAMACGIPCVVPDVGDITDAAINGVNAMVIDDPYDVNGFADAIISLLNNAELYKKLSENTKMVREKYWYESATKAWNGILDSLKG